MQVGPEAQILILNATITIVAYGGIYPGLTEKTLGRIMAIDVVLTLLAVTVAGALFRGNTNWFVFTLLTLAVIEVPLFLHFAKRHGMNLFDDSDG